MTRQACTSVCVCVCVRADAAAEFEIQNASNLILLSCKAEQEESKRERERESVQLEGGSGQRGQGGRPSMSCCWTLAKNALAVAVRGVAKVEGTSFGLSLACLANEMKARARVCERVSDSACVCVRLCRTPARMRAKDPQAARWLAIRCRKRGAWRCRWKWR